MYTNLFIPQENFPYHISIGQIIINNNNEIALIKRKDYYTIPKETPNVEESIVDTLRRGAKEEIGVDVEPIKYIGRIASVYTRDGLNVEKTTVIFASKVTGISERQPEEYELNDEIVWINMNDAKELLGDRSTVYFELVLRAFKAI